MSTGIRPVEANYSRKQVLPLHQSQDLISAHEVSKVSMIHPCDANFMMARLNPWGSFREAPCNPVRNAVDSFKVRMRWVGTMQCGPNGDGFVAINAFNPYTLYPGPPASPLQAISLSDAAYIAGAGGSYIIGGSINPGINYQSWLDTPFSTDDALAGSFKVVGCGVKMCDIGQLNLTAGKLVKFSCSDHRAPIGQIQFGQAQINQKSITKNISVSECYFNTFQSFQAEDDDLKGPTDVQGVNTQGAHFGFLVQGASPSRQFNVEICAWYEYVPQVQTYNGPNPYTSRFTSVVTGSHVTTQGAKVTQVARHVNETTMTTREEAAKVGLNEHHNGLVSEAIDKVKAIPFIGKGLGVVEDIAKAVLPSPLVDLAETVLPAIGFA